jgi:DNA-binding MarR family transcriptional regulator
VNEYFEHIVKNLTIEEMGILAVLSDMDSTAAFKAVRRTEVLGKSELTIAHFRKAVGKLVSACLVNVVPGSKEQKVFLTEYGLKALEFTLKEAE